jgi:hypothetical protein
MEVQDSARAGDRLQSAIKNIAIDNKAEYFGITVPHIKTVLGLTGVATPPHCHCEECSQLENALQGIMLPITPAILGCNTKPH